MSDTLDLYQIMLQNKIGQKEFKVVFKDGSEISGIPFCGSFVKLTDMHFDMKIVDDNGKKSIHQFSISEVYELIPED